MLIITTTSVTLLPCCDPFNLNRVPPEAVAAPSLPVSKDRAGQGLEQPGTVEGGPTTAGGGTGWTSKTLPNQSVIPHFSELQAIMTIISSTFTRAHYLGARANLQWKVTNAEKRFSSWSPQVVFGRNSGLIHRERFGFGSVLGTQECQGWFRQPKQGDRRDARCIQLGCMRARLPKEPPERTTGLEK